MLKILRNIKFKNLIYILSILFGGTALMILGSNLWVITTSKQHVYNTIKEIPSNDVALVLGSGKKTRRGTINLYFKYRMQAAANLYKSGKVKHLLVSGDNHATQYDEATDMRDYLIQLGVPSRAITCDYAGFRTLDSVVRAKKVFGQKRITIISQNAHNERAVFLAKTHGIQAIGYNAQDVPSKYSKKQHVREYLAKFKAVLDTYVLFCQPKYLGNPINISV